MKPGDDVIECRYCNGTGRMAIQYFDFVQDEPCVCTKRDTREQARAALALKFTSNPNRQQKRAPMMAPRS